MNVSIKRTNDAFQMTGTNGSGKQVIIDASAQAGGNGSGVSPMEMVLMAIGSCSSIDIIDILKKQNEPIGELDVSIDGKRAETVPKVFTDVKVTFAFKGDLNPRKVLRAVNLSMEKYCSVSKMIEKAANISSIVTLNGEEVML